MSDEALFRSSQGEVKSRDIREVLKQVGASECNVLYIHSQLSFGLPESGVSRRDLLDRLLEEIYHLNVRTICMPTYTFSFCNNQVYNVLKSRSRMGALNEHFRAFGGSERSLDPLLSVAVRGYDLDLIANLGPESIGTDSTFAKISNRNDVRFLFLGTDLGSCFTYMHHLEWKAQVPYRYDRTFRGTVTHDSESIETTATLFVRYQGVEANDASYTYEKILADLGNLKVSKIGDGPVSTVDITSATEVYMNLLADNPNFFITEPFDRSRVTPDFTAVDMVAL